MRSNTEPISLNFLMCRKIATRAYTFRNKQELLIFYLVNDFQTLFTRKRIRVLIPALKQLWQAQLNLVYLLHTTKVQS